MLPGMSGLDLCRRLRAAKDRVSILMLSAMASTEDRIEGLRTGADDYMTKPFDFDELVARIEALHRRALPADDTGQDSGLAVGPIRFNPSAMQVFVDGEELDLSGKERDLLVLLMRNSGRVCSRERLLNAVWGYDSDPLTNVVDVTVSRIRRKLSDHAEMIATIRGYGYRMQG